MKRYLILEDGSSYAGDGIGAMITATGELAIQTSNYGYQEVLTDPVKRGQDYRLYYSDDRQQRDQRG